MPVIDYTYKFKEDKDYDSVMEFARLQNDKYLFDEISIKKINMVRDGHEFVITYTRLGKELKDVPAIYVSAVDFAAARAQSDGDREKFASTDVVKRLFAEGTRHWIETHKTAEVDILKDADFIANLS